MRWPLHFDLPFAACLFFSAGAEAATSSALSTYLMRRMHVSYDFISMLWLYMSWVYWTAPAAAALSDAVAIRGDRRFILIGSLGCCAAVWLTLIFVGLASHSKPAIIALCVMQSVFTLFTDAAQNAILVRLGQRRIVASRESTAIDSANGMYPITGLVPLQIEAAVAAEACAADVPTIHLNADGVETYGTESTATTQRAVANEGVPADGAVPLLQAADVVHDAASVATTTTTVRTLTAAEVADLDDSGAVQSEAEAVRSVGSLVGQIALTLCAVGNTDGSLGFLITGGAFYLLAIVPVIFSTKSFIVKHAGDHYERRTVAQFARDFILRVVTLIRSITARRAGGNSGLMRLETLGFLATVCFVIILTAMPSGGSMYSYYTSDVTMDLPAWYFQLQYSVGLLGSLLGCIAYRRWFAKWSAWNTLALAAAAGAISYTTNILFATGVTTNKMHIPVSVFVCLDAMISGLAGRVAYVPIVHVAASMAPKGYEATAFDVFTTAGMIGPTISTLLSVRLAKAMHVTVSDFSNLTWFLVVCAATQLAPMVLLLAGRVARGCVSRLSAFA